MYVEVLLTVKRALHQMLILLSNPDKGMYIKTGKVENFNTYTYKLYSMYVHLITMLYIDNIMTSLRPL